MKEDPELPRHSIGVLLGSSTSRPNKLALAEEHRSRGFYLEWEWQGKPMQSRFPPHRIGMLWGPRLCFLFSPRDRLFEAKSYEEDVAPLLDERTGGRP